MGLCVKCSEKVFEGHSLCEKHLEEQKKRSRLLKSKYRQEGRCVNCGRELHNGKKRCDPSRGGRCSPGIKSRGKYEITE